MKSAYKHIKSGTIYSAITHCQAIMSMFDKHPEWKDDEFEMGFLDDNDKWLEYSSVVLK